ncbi:hypothetical protein WA026_015136 [Henosepilachna vigintioctopunctata]|uniref:Uncharacterized protein n=1 Tax=Henosepilachna vigintioctopunctata TaxID=420089 RepID=A0AAW1TKP0_9CUCU
MRDGKRVTLLSMERAVFTKSTPVKDVDLASIRQLTGIADWNTPKKSSSTNSQKPVMRVRASYNTDKIQSTQSAQPQTNIQHTEESTQPNLKSPSNSQTMETTINTSQRSEPQPSTDLDNFKRSNEEKESNSNTSCKCGFAELSSPPIDNEHERAVEKTPVFATPINKETETGHTCYRKICNRPN